jgi:hypothetical protein
MRYFDELCTPGINHTFLRCLTRLDRLERSCAVAIPSSVLFESSAAFEWLYAPGDIDAVRTHDIADYSVAAVVSSFCSSPASSRTRQIGEPDPIVAVALHLPTQSGCCSEGHATTDVELLSRQALVDFLNRPVKSRVLLQECANPLGSYMVASWSPATCTVDVRGSLLEMLCVKEASAPSKPGVLRRLSPQTFHRIRLACERVARHLELIARTTSIRVTHMSLNFRLCPSGRLFLLFSQAVRVDGIEGPRKALTLGTAKRGPAAVVREGRLLAKLAIEKEYGGAQKPLRLAPLTYHKDSAPKGKRRHSQNGFFTQSQEFFLTLIDDLVSLIQQNSTQSGIEHMELERVDHGRVKIVTLIPSSVAAAVPAFILEDVFEALGGKCVTRSDEDSSNGRCELVCTVDPFVLDVAEELTRSRVMRVLSNIVFEVKTEVLS